VQLGKWGVQKVFYFALESPAATSSDRFVTTAGIFVAGDSKISKDGGAFANTTNLPVQVSGALYAVTLTAAEMQADDIDVLIIDQNGPVWRDLILQVSTRLDIGLAVRTNLATAGAAATITLDAAASAVDNFYNELSIQIIGGTGVGQVRTAVSYVGATKVLSVNRAWTTNPDNTSVFTLARGGDVWDQIAGPEINNASLVATTTRSMRVLMQALFMRFYNLVNQTSGVGGVQKVFLADSVTALATMPVSDDGVTQSKGKAV